MHRPYIWLETWRHRQRDVLALDKKMWDALICFSQEQETRRKYIKYHIDKSVNSPLFIMRGESGETISHIVSKYSKVTQMNYKWRHDNVARTFHWKLCEKFSLEKLGKLHLHNPQTVTENLNLGQIWDVNIQFDNVTMERRPDIVTDNKMDKTAIIIDVAVPGERE